MTDSVFVEIFKRLDKWRGFPAYKLEPRVDIFFSLYLEEVVERRLGVGITGIVPEFPIRLGSLKGDNDPVEATDNLSFKADYLLKSRGISFLLELKTDSKSIKMDQIKYLEDARNSGSHKLLRGALELRTKTLSRTKYENLLSEIFGPNSQDESRDPSSLPDSVEIIYIVPDKKAAKDKGLHDKPGTHVIDFDYFAESVLLNTTRDPEFNRMFAEQLKKWRGA